MLLETTFYISEDNYQKLEDKKTETGFSKNRIIGYLLRKETREGMMESNMLNTINYQEKLYEDQKFRRLHVGIDDELYEKCLDMRKMFKLSVSYILALCIHKYLDDIGFDELDTDNYPVVYMYFCIKEKCIEGYFVNWSLPPQKPPEYIELIRKLSKL